MLANFDRKWSRSFFSSPKPLKNPIKAKRGFVGLLEKGSITKMEREPGKAGNFSAIVVGHLIPSNLKLMIQYLLVAQPVS